jgi:hypothetical protein
MKNTNDNGFMVESLNPDFDLKELLVNELIEISKRAKYDNNRTKIKKKPLDKSILKAMKSIEDNSMDITENYSCAPILGLSLADEYGENARDCFHKICKNNKQYSVDQCNKEYSNYLNVESILMEMVPFYYLLAESFADEINTLINEKSKTSKL